MLQDTIALLERGGPLIYPLLLCSVLVVYITLLKVLTLRSSSLLPKEGYAYWEQRLLLLCNPEKIKASKQEAPPYPQAILSIALIPIVHRWPLPPGRLESALQDQFRQIRNSLESKLTLLDTLSSIAPLLGLLGTALGMLGVFGSLEQGSAPTDGLFGANSAGVNNLGGYISEALLTTVFGLSIGILALFAANMLYKRVENIMLSAEEQVNRLLLESMPTAPAEPIEPV